MGTGVGLNKKRIVILLFLHGEFFLLNYKMLNLQALDTSSNETVAIKKMSFSGKQAAEKWQDIIKEVRFLKNVCHRHIVQYKACFLKDNTCWVNLFCFVFNLCQKPVQQLCFKLSHSLFQFMVLDLRNSSEFFCLF